MKRTLLTIASACCILFATACNNPETNQNRSHTNEELANEESTHQHTEREQLSNTNIESAEAETAAFEQVPAAAKKQVQQLTTHYLEIKNALVASNAAAAKEAASKLTPPLDGFKATTLPAEQQDLYMQQAGAIREAANGISKANSVDAQRKHLGTLSQAVYTLNKSFAGGENQLYQQFCPMANNNKGGYWLSAEKEIRNPYFGDQMLKCGKVVETL
ncbi:hypothetical protein D770_05805 [Flammeovirgaceae bacterium 311]|nr:hypothetical protein D770_05805 [Flammeovirgaceae bacterium 311]